MGYFSADTATAILIEQFEGVLEIVNICFTKMWHFTIVYIRYIMRENKPEPSLSKSVDRNKLAQLRQFQNQAIITPYHKRSMTDISCTWVYCLLSIIVITAFFCSYILDKDDNIFKPRDPDYNKCGYDKASSYPYIYFPAPFAESIDEAVCVKQCPTSSASKIECLPNSAVGECTFNMSNHFNRSNQFIVYPTERNTFLWMCQPSSRIIFDAVNEKINTHYLFMNLSNLYESMYILIVVCPIISIVLVAIYVCIVTRIKDLTNIFIGFIVAFTFILVGFSIYSFLPAAKRVFPFMPYIGIVVLAIAACFIAYMVYYRGYIKESLGLLNKGAQYIRSNRSLIFLSLVFFLLWAIIFILEIIALLFIYSMDTASISPDDPNRPSYTFAYFTGIQNTVVVKILMILAILHYLWTNLILYSMGEYICMAAGSFWILNRQRNFKNALYTLLKFHLGSVIYGSLVNVVCGKLTAFLYFLMPRSNHRLCCCYLPKWSDFYRKNLFLKKLGIYNDLNYIRVAIKGENLEEAGCKLTTTLVENLNDVSRAYRLARVVVFISKVLVAFTTTFICYAIMELSHNMKGSFFTNVIIFIISSFLVSFAFESYDRSFQVILVTILIKKQERENQAQAKGAKGPEAFSKVRVDGEGTNQEQTQNLEEQIIAWFQKQKKQQENLQVS